MKVHLNKSIVDAWYDCFVINKPIVFTGQVELNLNRMPKPAKSARRCTLEQLPSYDGGKASSSVETVSLFEMKRVYGWWPCGSQELGEEMQLTVSIGAQAR